MLDVNKIFGYELRRMLGSKLFWGLTAVIIWYAWQLLNGVTMLGVAGTAPFSPWSFGSYLTQLLPLLGVVLLLFIWKLCDKQARGVSELTDSMPVDHGKYQLTKYLTALAAWLMLALLLVVLGIVFLCRLFGGAVPVASLLLVSAVVLLPIAALLLGVGALAGGFRPLTLPIIMALTVAAGFLPGDFYGEALFSEYPLTLGVLDPAFSMPVSAVIGKLAVLIFGAVLLLLALGRRDLS